MRESKHKQHTIVGASVAWDPPAQRHPISGYAMGLVTWEPERGPSVAYKELFNYPPAELARAQVAAVVAFEPIDRV